MKKLVYPILYEKKSKIHCIKEESLAAPIQAEGFIRGIDVISKKQKFKEFQYKNKRLIFDYYKSNEK